MAVADASFKISIETISLGLMAASGLLESSDVEVSITTPSITKIGCDVKLIEFVPRIRILELPPGVPELA